MKTYFAFCFFVVNKITKHNENICCLALLIDLHRFCWFSIRNTCCGNSATPPFSKHPGSLPGLGLVVPKELLLYLRWLWVGTCALLLRICKSNASLFALRVLFLLLLAGLRPPELVNPTVPLSFSSSLRAVTNSLPLELWFHCTDRPRSCLTSLVKLVYTHAFVLRDGPSSESAWETLGTVDMGTSSQNN